jgi:plastocyanin
MNAIKNFFRLVGACVGVMIFAHALHGFAGTVTVFVGNTNLLGTAADVFVPAVTNINVNDQVVWVWEGTPHSTTSGTNGVPGDDNGVPSGMWDSMIQFAQPHSFTNTFTSTGSFSYYCSVHYGAPYFMTGAVNVAAAPIVLSAPRFLPPADFRFDYTANVGLNYIVQRSTDLTGSNWTTLGTNQAGGSPVIFDDTNATGNPAFYRVGVLPNP